MGDWKTGLQVARRKMNAQRSTIIKIPSVFSFKNHDVYDFDRPLKTFDWGLRDRPVTIDLSECKSANYQALSLISLYAWKLVSQRCRVSFVLNPENSDATKMWRLMGATSTVQTLLDESQNFPSKPYKPLIAVREAADFKLTISKIEEFTQGFNIEYENTLRYVLSELLYNTLEHGASHFQYYGRQNRMPSICQCTWYEGVNEVHFIVADTGMGVKAHLRQTYPTISDDLEALRASLRPKVSGTFGRYDPYQAKNNAGMGLFLSSNIVRRLGAEMYLVSGSGVIHVTARDITTRELKYGWPGTFALVTVKLDRDAEFELHKMMQEFREAANSEQKTADAVESDETYYLSIFNYFGPNAEVKEEAVRHRDKYLLPAIDQGKKILIDFDQVNSAPHSFLSALVATPVKRLGMSAYKRLRIINATPEIRETIDFIMDENTD